MPRIRTVKPEFWEDEVVGLLPRDARLLFIATFNLADDEGLLRWAPAYIKASAFMYDDDLSVNDVAKLMHHLTDAGLLFPYVGGVARQQMACVVNFRKHQKVNRPQKSKMPPPSLQNVEVRRMYARRDGWTCHLCGGQIPEQPVGNDSYNLSIDHLTPQSKGGSDHPSNVRAAHQGCNKGRRDQGTEDFTTPHSMRGLNDSLNGSVNDSRGIDNSQRDEPAQNLTDPYTHSEINSLNGSVNDSLPSSLPEGKGREGNREQGKVGRAEAAEQTEVIAATEADFVGAAEAADAPEPVTARTLISEWLDRCAKRPPKNVIGQISKQIKDLLAEGIDPDDVRAGLALWMRKGLHPSTLPSVVNEAMNTPRQHLPAAAGAENVLHLPAARRPSITDQRVAEGMALADRLAAEEGTRP